MTSTTSTTTTDPTSPPPPPPLPPTTVTTTTPKPTTTITTAPPLPQPQPQRPIKSPPQFHHPPPFQRPTLHSAQTQTHLGKSPSDPIRYPLASSGRGLLPSPRLLHHPQLQLSSEQVITNSGNLPQIQGNNNNNNSNTQHPFLHPSPLPPHFSRLSSPVRPILPHSKASPSPYTTPDSIIPKDSIEKETDDQLVTVGDRKVRISDGASLYALCRSWLRNGYLEENKLQFGDVLKSLAKPLPLPKPESSPSKRKEQDEETEVDEVEKDEDLTAEELLSRHVKRAKKVRARLREERLQRIDRYKGRLSLLLPPVFQD